MEINRMGLTPQLTSNAAAKPKKEAEETPGDMVQLGSGKVDEGVQKKWLFMNFIAGDCNLKSFQERNIDNQEKIGSDENTHIVAMMDVGPSGSQLQGKWTGARTFYVTKDMTPDYVKSPVIAQHGNNVDMSAPEVLTKFIVDTMNKFPAENTALILNNHGGGLVGAMSDDTDGDIMSIPNLHKAFADAEKITGKKLDIIGFDACLMAEAEVAHEFKNDAKILLASEETEGGPGWIYNEMLGKGKEAAAQSIAGAIQQLQTALGQRITVGVEDFAKIVVKQNEAHQRDIPTFSATDLTKMDALTKSVDAFAQTIIASGEKSAIKTAFKQGDKYGGGYNPYKDLRDLHNLADNVGKAVTDPAVKEAAANVKKAFKDAIIANEHSPKYPNSEGLTIYAPTTAGNGPGYKYGDMAFAKETKWADALKEVGKAGGTSYVDTNFAPQDVPEFLPDGSPFPTRKNNE
jgi:hypothetical protein